MEEFPSASDNPFQSPVVSSYTPPPRRRKPELSEGSIFVTWLVFYFGSIIATVVIAFPVGMLVGVVMASQKLPMKEIQLFGQLAGGLIGIIMSYVAFRIVVRNIIIPKIKQSE